MPEPDIGTDNKGSLRSKQTPNAGKDDIFVSLNAERLFPNRQPVSL